MVKLDIDVLAAKVGGRFHLVSLVQKRVRELMQGADPMVEVDEDMTLEDIAAAEALEGKLDLVVGDEAEELRKKKEKEVLSSADTSRDLPWKALGDEAEEATDA